MEPLLAIAKKLCRNVTGSQCSTPRLSSWTLVAPSQSSISVDVADIATGGAGAVIPANVKIYGSYFTSGLEYNGAAGGMSAYMYGYGAGGGVGAGWGIPVVGAKGIGRLPDGIKKKVLSAVAGSFQGKAIDLLKGAAWGGISGGTRLVAGPDVRGELTADDFHDALVTVVGLGANFVVNGVSLGVIIVSKQRPVLTTGDMLYAKAIGLMGGIGLATSLDVEASGMVYRVALS